MKKKKSRAHLLGHSHAQRGQTPRTTPLSSILCVSFFLSFSSNRWCALLLRIESKLINHFLFFSSFFRCLRLSLSLRALACCKGTPSAMARGIKRLQTMSFCLSGMIFLYTFSFLFYQASSSRQPKSEPCVCVCSIVWGIFDTWIERRNLLS